MESEPVSDDLQSFIAEHVHSQIALELLLLLHAHSARQWTAQELARELRAAPEWTERELQDLARRGMVTVSSTTPPRFQYAPPQRAELEQTIAKLAAIYSVRRFSIIQLIFSAPSGAVQSFADAFRLRKDRSDG